jgi:hypothetical protein
MIMFTFSRRNLCCAGRKRNARSKDFEGCLGGWSQTIDRDIDTTRGMIREAMS